MTNLRMKRILKPAVEPVSLAEMKSHLTIAPDFTEDDALLLDMMAAARQDAEDYLGCVLAPSSWLVALDRFPARRDGLFLPGGRRQASHEITVPHPPLIGVNSFQYLDGFGTLQTLAPIAYLVDTISAPGRIVPVSGSWPLTAALPNAVQIQVTAGFVETVQTEVLLVPPAPGPYAVTLRCADSFYSVLRLYNAQGESLTSNQYLADKGVLTLVDPAYAGAALYVDYLITAAPAHAKQAIKLQAAAYYANREAFLSGVKLEQGDWFTRTLDGVGRSQLFGWVA